MEKVKQYVNDVFRKIQRNCVEYSGLCYFIIVVSIFVFCILFHNYIFVGLKFCDRRPESIDVVVTVAIAFFTAGFSLHQFFLLKRKDKIRIHELYNSIDKTLETHKQHIESWINDYHSTDNVFMSVLAKERRIDQEICNMIYELEKLLYEHGRVNDKEYTEDVINLVKNMLELISIYNSVYEVLKDENSIIVSDEGAFQKLKDKIDGCLDVVNNYRTKRLNNIIV